MNRSASTLWFLGRAIKSTAVRAAIACLLMKKWVQMGPGRSASRGRKSGAGKSWKRGGICVASRCQVAHDFTQRHVLAACAEAAIPAPRYLLKIGSVRDAAGPGPTFSNVNLSLVCLSLVM
jgi:hypothetical protein